MANRFNEIVRLAQETFGRVSSSPGDWVDYLRTAARNYRYSFKDQLLLYAQRPDARACASIELWNNRMHCWVNRGAKGIALIDDSSPRPKLKYVFDFYDQCLLIGKDGRFIDFDMYDGNILDQEIPFRIILRIIERNWISYLKKISTGN